MYHFQRISIICFFFLSVTILKAQDRISFVGIINEVNANKPVFGAIASIKSTKNTPVSAISDSTGTFKFFNLDTGFYSLSITHVSYDTYTDSFKIISGTKFFERKISLKLKTATLGGVVVASKLPPISYVGDKMVFNVSSTTLGVGNNAYDLLRTTPQVVADHQGTISVLGKNAMITIDGKQTNLSGEDLKTYLTNIPGQTVDKIEVISSPGAKYDAQAGAVINIKTIKPSNLGTNGTISAGAGIGTYGLYNTGITINNRTSKTNVYATYNFDHTAQINRNTHTQQTIGFDTEVFESSSQKNFNNTHNIKFGVDRDINSRNSAGFLVKGNINSRTNAYYNNSIAYNNDISYPDSSSGVLSNGKTNITAPSINGWYKNILNKKGAELSINADYFNYDKKWAENFETSYSIYTSNETRPTSYIRQNSPGNNRIQSYAADYSSPIKKGKVEAGIKSTFTKTDNNVVWENNINNNWETDLGKTNHFVYKENINAAYVSLTQMLKKYTIVGGVRAEQTITQGILVNERTDRNNYISLFPTVSITNIKNANNIFTLSYKRSIVRYGFNFVNPFIIYRSQYSYSQGNPNLQPQINNNVGFTWIYKQKLVTALSYVRAKDVLAPIYLTSEDNPNVIISSYDNLQSLNQYVASITYSGKMNKWWQSTNSINAFHLDYSGKDGVQIENSGNITVTANSVNNFRISSIINADLTAVYMSPMASGIFRMQTIFTVNAGVSASILKGRGTVKLNARDLFNTYKIDYNTNYMNVKANYHNKFESRFFNILFTYKFGNTKIKETKTRKTSIDDEVNRMNSN